MGKNKRIFLLALIMAVVAISIGGASIGILYNTAFDVMRSSLAQTARSHARLIEALARHENKEAENKEDPAHSFNETLSQIRDAHEKYRWLGKSGEFTLAIREGDSIVFKLSHRHSDLDNPRSIPIASKLAEPMRRALAGKSGTVVGLDYRGVTVLAAHEPVTMFGLGVVAKVDLAEIRAPFIKAGAIVTAIAMALIAAGCVLFISIFNPIIRRIQESEERVRLIAETANDAIISANSEGKIIFWNYSAETIFGYSEPEALGMDITELMPERYREEHLNGFARVNGGEGGRPGKNARFHGRRKDGGEFSIELSIASWKNDDRFFHTAIIRDITYHLRAEKNLRESEQKLHHAQKLEAIGQLTGGVAHDFNNILAVVLGNLEFLEETIDENDPRRRLVERACDGARRGAQLTERLLAFSRKQHLEPEVLSVSQVISATVEILRRTLGETISIKTSIAGSLHPVLADRGQLENAILNLAVNARDAMPQGGTLCIDMRDVVIKKNDNGTHGELAPGRYVCIAVKDTGHGMTEDVKDRVFDPFFTTKESGHGTGLGLSMVYGFAKQSGGLVRIESDEGKGATIEILLPAAINEKTKPNDTAKKNKRVQGRGETVLVVEDEPEVRSLAVEMLYDLGYRVLEAENGDKAIDIVRDKPRIDLLFTDVLMPGSLTGKELAREACRHAKNLKVVFTSGHPADHLSGSVPNDEKLILIRKPYTKRKLAETIRSVLDS